ncbi:ankyrin [Anaeromyces robustus]|uniref:Ankyrin n=1 Tax=Anaeromyces robustus TaxID=1754192 RepID=A0A1Y1XH13_9FUNG|nr:ankyrin [Anaeromyces robustus]|eukprot:ORX85013.1 ankyrin [Anaeromyces robustus]
MEIKQKLIEIIKKTNSLIDVKRSFNEILEDFSSDFNDLLIVALEHNASYEILEYLLSCKPLYIFNMKTLLLYSIECNNFKFADLLFEYGVDINDIENRKILYMFYEIDSKTVKYVIKYLLKKGFIITPEFIMNLIKYQENTILNYFLKFVINDCSFVLKLISFKKNKNISNQQINEIIKDNSENEIFNKNIYDHAFEHRNFEAIHIIYKYDIWREEDMVLNDIYELSTHKYLNVKGEITNFIKENQHLNFSVKFAILFDVINDNMNEKILDMIRDNNFHDFKKFIEKNEINLQNYSNKYDKYGDILKMALIYDTPFKTFKYLFQECKYKNLNYKIERNSKSTTLIHSSLSLNKYKIYDFLKNKGADINFMGDTIDIDFTSKNIKYLLHDNFRCINKIRDILIINNKLSLLRKTFDLYIFNNSFIINLLSIRKNNTLLSKQQLNDIIIKEKSKAPINKSLYKTAIQNNNDSAINILIQNDNRELDIILNELYQLLNHNEIKIKILTRNIYNGELPIKNINNSYFLKNLSINENIKKQVLNLIKMNDVNKLCHYIKNNDISLLYYNNLHFDIIMYAIENNCSLKMIKYLITTLNYKLNYLINYKNILKLPQISPLYFAIEKNNFKIAKLLLNSGADIDYKIDNNNNNNIMDIFLCHNNKFLNNKGSTKKLIFLLNHYYYISPKKFNYYITEICNKFDYFIDILQYYIYNTSFILKLLQINKNKEQLSDKSLKKLLYENGKSTKIIVDYKLFNNTYNIESSDILDIYLNYYWDWKTICNLKENIIYKLLGKIIYYENYSFIDMFFNSCYLNNKSFYIENFISNEYIYNSYNKKSLYYFISRFFDIKILDFKEINLELLFSNLYLLLSNSDKSHSCIEEFKLCINKILKHKSFNLNNCNLKNVFFPPTKYEWSMNENLYNTLKWLIDKFLNHEALNFKRLNFLKIIKILYKNKLILFFFNTLFNCKRLNIKELNFYNLFKSVLIINNKKYIYYIMEKLLNNKSFNFEDKIIFEKSLLAIEKLGLIQNNSTFRNYYMDKILNHKNLDYSSFQHLKNFFITISKTNNNFIIDNFVSEMFKPKRFTLENFNMTQIEDILISLCYINSNIINDDDINNNNKNNNIFIMKWIIEKYLSNFDNILLFNFENILLLASKKNNINVMTLIIEKILNIKSLNLLKKIFFIRLIKLKLLNILEKNEKENNTSYFILLLNVLIKLHLQNVIIYLLEDIKLNHNIDIISRKDKNNEYPIMVALTSYSTNYINESINIFKYLLNYNVNWHIKDIYGNSLLQIAFKNENYSILKILLNRDIVKKWKINISNSSPLMNAIYLNDIDMVKYIIKNNLNNNDYDINNNKNNLNNIDYDINNNKNNYYNDDDKCKDTDEKNKYEEIGKSALDICIYLKNKYIFSMLLKYQNTKSINEFNNHGETVLMTLIKMSHFSYNEKIEWMNQLICKGANLNRINKNGKFLLNYAFDTKSKPLIYFLLKKGANINKKNHFLESSLTYVINHCDIEMTKLLAKYNPSLFTEDIIKTIIEQNKFNLIKVLIPKYIDINRKNGNDLNIALKTGNIQIIEYFINLTCSLNNTILTNIENITYFDVDILKIVLKKFKININAKIKNGNTLIDYALLFKNKNVVQYLIEHGANLNKKNDYGNTPLIHAVKYNNDISIIRELINNGSDINVKNNLRETVLQIENKKENKNIEIINYLKSIG